MIITISREYGAGGHSIGKSVAKELGIEFYDRDIIKAAVKESGLEMPEVERVEEEITRTGFFLRMIAPAAYVDAMEQALGGIPLNHAPFTAEDTLAAIRKEAI